MFHAPMTSYGHSVTRYRSVLLLEWLQELVLVEEWLWDLLEEQQGQVAADSEEWEAGMSS